MSCAPLKGDGGVVRFGPRAAGQRRLLCTNNLCLSPSYARHATPTVHSLSPRRSAGTAPRAIFFRETLFHGMDIPPTFAGATGGFALARPSRCHRPQDT